MSCSSPIAYKLQTAAGLTWPLNWGSLEFDPPNGSLWGLKPTDKAPHVDGRRNSRQVNSDIPRTPDNDGQTQLNVTWQSQIPFCLIWYFVVVKWVVEASGIFYKERTGYYHTQLDFSAHISKLNLVEILSHYKFYVWMSTITATTYTHGAATVKIPGIIRLCYHFCAAASFSRIVKFPWKQTKSFLS